MPAMVADKNWHTRLYCGRHQLPAAGHVVGDRLFHQHRNAGRDTGETVDDMQSVTCSRLGVAMIMPSGRSACSSADNSGNHGAPWVRANARALSVGSTMAASDASGS